MFARKQSTKAADVDLRFVSDAYWTPPGPAALIEVPPAMFMYAAPTISRMEVFASAVFEKTAAAPMGEFFFLVDREGNRTLAAYSHMDECSVPMWVDSIDLIVVARELRDQCRRDCWATEAYS
ncbi:MULTISPECIES: hypothetical protein [unclassified Rhizobium]|uniref:hypothetical protein n=1 Tax=unclassified Rhizobium TaxID=2613769 RepID=UPI0007155FBE|nr:MULTISPECIES: hypothetical protein [unclassified Rhizobium]KQT01800.1 hypothetical protein ASG50_19115 [Rhizobium sp. Leaf386]KQT03242.1 hypothetical protein ASG42_24865 [Rhizobium sp. Leaf391]KQU08349.1 hypothetical protein ASG68_22420 [Rhizobium sp. Leaf453]